MNKRIALGAVGAALIALALYRWGFPTTFVRAHLGGVDSQLVLAYSYGTGEGAERDEEKAAYWYRRAAEQGDPRGQLALAARYDEGLGVPKDAEEATRWFRAAAEQGEPEAQLALAFRHEEGRGVSQDRVQAAMWMILADRYVTTRSDAMELLQRLKAELSETDLAEARRLAADWRAAHPAPQG
jgi:TPR repeat protein